MILSRILLYCLLMLPASNLCAVFIDHWKAISSSEYLINYCIIGAAATALIGYTVYKKHTTHTWWWKHYSPVFSNTLQGLVDKTRYNQQRELNMYDLSKVQANNYDFIQYCVLPQNNNECGYDALLNSLIILKQFLIDNDPYQADINTYLNYYRKEESVLNIESLLINKELRQHFFRQSDDVNRQQPWRAVAIDNYKTIALHYKNFNKDITNSEISPLEIYANATSVKQSDLTNASILDACAIIFLINSIVQKFPYLHEAATFFIAAQGYDLHKKLSIIYPHSANLHLSKTFDQLKQALKDKKTGIIIANVKTTLGGSHWISLLIKKDNDKFIIVGTDSLNKPIIAHYPFVTELIKKFTLNDKSTAAKELIDKQ